MLMVLKLFIIKNTCFPSLPSGSHFFCYFQLCPELLDTLALSSNIIHYFISIFHPMSYPPYGQYNLMFSSRTSLETLQHWFLQHLFSLKTKANRTPKGQAKQKGIRRIFRSHQNPTLSYVSFLWNLLIYCFYLVVLKS